MDMASSLGSTVTGGQISLIIHQRALPCVSLKPTFMVLGIRVCGLGGGYSQSPYSKSFGNQYISCLLKFYRLDQ